MKVIESIQIKNPHVRRLVAEEVKLGTGRNHSEAAENLILEAVARRAEERARTSVIEQRSEPQPVG